ncbi:MAG: adenylate/guanylate cyclase domain-containing protein [Myxococcota bacterium]
MTHARLLPMPVTGNTATETVLLSDNRISFGRALDNSVVIADGEISKHHAEIVCQGETYTLRDLGSSNGTFVDGARITEVELANDQAIELGNARYSFKREVVADVQLGVSVVPGKLDQTVFLASSPIEEMLSAAQLGTDTESLKKAYEKVRTAFGAVQELWTETKIPMLCAKILEVTFDIVRAENGAILLYDEERNLKPVAHLGGQHIVSSTIIDEVVERRAAVLASDAATDSRWDGAKSIAASGVRSLMCVPLISAEDVIGVLHVGNSHEVGAYTVEDLELINGIGIGAGLALSNALMSKQLVEEAKVRDSLGRFLSPVLLEKVMEKSVDIKRGGQLAEVTVMFADIRGFTSLTERSQPTDVVELLNEYFDRMVEVVFSHGGVLDKFIGDALMAVWGAPVAAMEDASRAVAAGKEMQTQLAHYNQFRAEKGLDPIRIGIGLASGECVSGVIGARRRMELTVIGDAVNLASRLAGVAQEGQVMCDEETYTRAGSPSGAEALPPTKVKGKEHPVNVYCVCDLLKTQSAWDYEGP